MIAIPAMALDSARPVPVLVCAAIITALWVQLLALAVMALASVVPAMAWANP